MPQLRALVIDTATRETFVATVHGDHATELRGTGRARADDLVQLIDQLLKMVDWQLADVQLIIVRRGVGSYTGLRVGVTVATTLGWTLAIPVLGLVSQAPQPLALSWVARRVRQHLSHAKKQSVSWRIFPKYAPWQNQSNSDRLRMSS